MKFLEARARQEAKMGPGPRENKGTQTSEVPPKGPPAPRADVAALADELNIDLATITGSGKDGTITKTDVRKAAAERDDPSGI